MCHNKPDICQCNPTTIIPADEEQLKRIAKLVEPKKEWVSMTDEEMLGLYNEYIAAVGLIGVFRAIEAKLKEKNT
jgi:hypothetical protein